jgi:hypoxanthine-DNA glycosylase
VLGSLPGQRSLAEQQYYAHPRNAFWRIMRDVYGVGGNYRERCDALVRCRVAVWDVLHSSVRPGSMDADIVPDTAEVNDFSSFFVEHPAIRRVLCNGQTAGRLFLRRALPVLPVGVPVDVMPSTSPAYASMSYDVKLQKWQAALTGRTAEQQETEK